MRFIALRGTGTAESWLSEIRHALDRALRRTGAV